MQKVNAIVKAEHVFEQCAHIFRKKGQSHSQNHLKQNNHIKAHPPYPKGHRKKDAMNEPT
jgi:hypothetical protein